MTVSAGVELRTGSQSPCILCGEQRWQPHLSGVLDYLSHERFDIDRCDSCGLMISRPFPGDDAIGRYYPPQYRGNRHGFTGKMRVALRRRAIESQFPNGFHGRLLDVGCGNGAFIQEMKRRGWNASATEIDSETVRRLRADGIDAKLPADAEGDGFAEPFDAVTCWHVLEHISRPHHVSAWVKTQLKPTGVFQATVPNARCLQARLFRRQWMHLDVPRHLYHFTPQTLRSLLTRAGFTITDSTPFALEYDWLGVIQGALNGICSQPNVLFDKLTKPPAMPGDDPSNASVVDTVKSYLLAPPLAAISLPPMLVAWMLGDGATLTMTCKLSS